MSTRVSRPKPKPFRDEIGTVIVNYCVEVAAVLGVPKSMAAIYGLCFASADPLSHTEICERLDLSSGSISQGLKALREMGALTVVARNKTTVNSKESPRSRDPMSNRALDTGRFAECARYAVDLEVRELALQWLEKRIYSQLGPRKNRLQAMLNSAAPDTIVRMRVQQLLKCHDQAETLVPIISAFLHKS